MVHLEQEDLLIIAKTYPEPSSKYRETTCVGAINAAGQVRRVFPVPFRFMDGERRFKKWQWIRARTARNTSDHRPESRRIDVDSIEQGDVIPSKDGWRQRLHWLEPHVLEGFEALEKRRQATGETIGFFRPEAVLGLDIVPTSEPEWTEKEWETLTREGLFDSDEVRQRSPLKKLPYGFYYRYLSATATGVEELRHKITDWEVGALFWNCYWNHGTNWEEPFRAKLEGELPRKDMVFMMGTMHRFPDKWLLTGLAYPPKKAAVPSEQIPLFA